MKKEKKKEVIDIEKLERQALNAYRTDRLKPFVGFWLFGIDRVKKDLYIYLFYLVSMIAAFLYFQFVSPHVHYGVNLFVLVPSVMLFSSFMSMESKKKKNEPQADSLSRFYLHSIGAYIEKNETD